jgi:hypothetical protein
MCAHSLLSCIHPFDKMHTLTLVTFTSSVASTPVALFLASHFGSELDGLLVLETNLRWLVDTRVASNLATLSLSFFLLRLLWPGRYHKSHDDPS